LPSVRRWRSLISVLYTDDDVELLEIARFFLEKSGELMVSTVASAFKALQMLRNSQFDAVISDYQMPEMNGIEFLKELRAKGDKTPFILFTGKGREEVVIEALNCGADFYIKKGGDAQAQYAELINLVVQAVQRHQAMEAVEHNAKRFRSLIENGYDIITIVNANGKISYISPSVQGTLGYRQEELLGKEIFGFVHPMDREGFVNGFQTILASGSSIILDEARIQHRNGSWRTIEGVARRVIEENGKAQIIINSRDITEKRQAEQRLDYLDKLVNSMSHPMFAMDNDLVIGFWNSGAEATFGYSAEEAVGRCWPDLLRTEFVDRSFEDAMEALKVNGYLIGKVVEFTKSGVPLRLTINSMAMRGENEDCCGYVAVTRPEMVEMGEMGDFSQAEYVLESMSHGIKDGISVLDSSLTITRTNRRMEEWYPHSLPLLGRKCYEAYHGRSEPCEVCPSRRTLETGEVAYEVVPKVEEGEVVGWMDLYTVPLTDFSTRKPVGVIEYVKDVTESKIAEELLRRANERLRLGSGISRHDILNQLTIISGCIDMVRSSSIDEKMKRIMCAAEEATKNIVRFLEFQRGYEKMGELTPEWINAEKACLKGISSLSHGDVSIKVNLEGLEIYSDRILEKVFYNLVDNSLKHGNNVKKIDIFFENGDGRLLMVCQDDGIGVPHDLKHVIFEPKHAHGLRLVKDILALSGITIQENGMIDEGARFEMSVPRHSFRISKPGS